jgi:hypothetical protein
MRLNAPQLTPFDPASTSPNFLDPVADLRPVAPPVFQRFPKWPQLPVELSETKPPSEPPSLFKGMLGGNLQTLVQDSTDHPERYDESTQLFLAELAAGTRTLEGMTGEDKAHLDRAVMDYAAPRPRAPRPPPPPPRPLARGRAQASSNPYAPGLQDDRAPQVETAGGPMSAYWWVQGDKV